MTSIFLPAWEMKGGTGGVKGERENSTPLDLNFNLASDLPLPGSDIKTQNHLPLTAGLAESMGLISYT